MLLNLLISSFASTASTASNCGFNPIDTIYISTLEDTNELGTCSAVNASIYIHGENNIGSLSALNGITEINGDLVITDNTEIRNLKGFQNLGRVHGEDLYLDQYSIVITDNSNLAFVDRVNWTSITDYPTKFTGNSNLSVVCDLVCNNCFGPGPFLCQSCKNTSFFNTSICLAECNEFHLNTTYCHHVAPYPIDLTINSINSTCFNYTWNFGENEPYLDTITGVEVDLGNYTIYNYTIDDTGYYYNRNFTDTFLVCGLIPDTSYSLTGMLFGNDLMSNHTRVSVLTEEYYINNISYVFVGHVNTTTNVLLVWNETSVPSSDNYFDTAFTFYEVEINSTNNFNYTNYNLTSRYLIFNLENGNYTITVRPGMYISNYEHEYFGEWFSLDFIIFVEDPTLSSTASSTPSSTASSTTSSGINNGDSGNNDTSKILLIIAIVIATIVFLIASVVLYDRYKLKKNNNMVSRLTGRNNSTDRNPAVAYSNSSYETPGFNNDPLYTDPGYDIGYSDVIVNETDDIGRAGAIKNGTYNDQYFEC